MPTVKKSATSTPKSTPKKTSAKTTTKATPKSGKTTPKAGKATPKKAAVTPKKSAKSTPKATPKTKKAASKVATPAKSPKKAAEPATETEEKPEEETETEVATPAKSKTTPKKAAATPKKTETPKKAATPAKATPKKSASSTPAKVNPKRKATTDASPAKKAKTGDVTKSESTKDRFIPEDMIIKDHKDSDVNLYELSQKSGIVIFTYPAASTPGCTKQVCFFRDSLKDFENQGYKVFGLSNDPPKKNQTFHTKQNLNYPLLSDPEAKLIRFLEANNGNAHKAIRSAFVILKGGKLEHSNIKVGPEPSKEWALKMVS